MKCVSDPAALEPVVVAQHPLEAEARLLVGSGSLVRCRSRDRSSRGARPSPRRGSAAACAPPPCRPRGRATPTFRGRCRSQQRARPPDDRSRGSSRSGRPRARPPRPRRGMSRRSPASWPPPRGPRHRRGCDPEALDFRVAAPSTQRGEVGPLEPAQPQSRPLDRRARGRASAHPPARSRRAARSASSAPSSRCGSFGSPKLYRSSWGALDAERGVEAMRHVVTPDDERQLHDLRVRVVLAHREQQLAAPASSAPAGPTPRSRGSARRSPRPSLAAAPQQPARGFTTCSR